MNLDLEEKKTSFLTVISKIISNFFNPLVSLLIYFIYLSFEKYTLQQALVYFLPILVIIIIPIVTWLTWNVKTGRYSNMDVSNREQRKSLYFFIGGSLIIYLFYYYVENNTLDFSLLFVFILLLLLQISNLYIKSSMHTAFNIFVAALFCTLNIKIGIIWLCIAFLVGFTRIILKRHTPKEVTLGATIAIIISFIYLYCNIQFQQP